MCWDNRDAYFKCLDSAGVLKPGDEGGACASEKVAYEKNCVKSWVRCSSQVSLTQSRRSIHRSNTLINDAYWLNNRREFCSS